MKKQLTRKKCRSLRDQGVLDNDTNLTNKFYPRGIQPKTDSQHQVFESYNCGQHMFLFGSAGTGKTFLPLYLAIRDVLDDRHEKIIIVRSAVPTRNIGFLPGDINEKGEVYEEAYKHLVGEMFNKKDAYDILKGKMKIEFTLTSFLRGKTMDNCIILMDECQSATEHEISTVLTRVGYNTRVILAGDMRQNDLTREESGFVNIYNTLNRMNSVDLIEFTTKDIVRSGFVKEFIEAQEIIHDQNLQGRSSRTTTGREGTWPGREEVLPPIRHKERTMALGDKRLIGAA